MSCRSVSPLLEAFVDGELPTDRVLEIEQHLLDCGPCGERLRLANALRTSIQRAAMADARPSAGFEARLRAAMAAEGERQAREQAPQHGKVLPWRTIVPLATAAAVSLVWAGASNDATRSQRAESQPRRTHTADIVTSVNGVDQLIEEFVEHHMRPSTPEVTEPSLVQHFEPQVGVPVRLPSLQQYGARWEGGSVVPAPDHSQRAASLQYRVGGHRVTLYVYNASRYPLRARLEPRVVRNMPVYVGNRHGYSIAAVESRGVGYAVATDLDDRESAELAAATVH